MSGYQDIQEAIRKAKLLAATISAPAKRPAEDYSSSSIKTTLAYEKPAPVHNDSHDRNEKEVQQPKQSSREQQHKVEIIIPRAAIALIIGKGGENIKRIQNETNANVRVDPNTIDESGNKLCIVTGSEDSTEKALTQIKTFIENATTAKRPRLMSDRGERYRMKIPASRTGAVIGKGGETIKYIKQQSGCNVELDKEAQDCSPDESVFVLRGSSEEIEKAKSLIESRLSNNRDNRDGRDARDNRDGRGSRDTGTGANATPIAPSSNLTPQPAIPSTITAEEHSAAWSAYYSQYYAQAGFSGQQAFQPQTQPQAQPQASSNNNQASGQKIYAKEWIEYYRKSGQHEQADALEDWVKKNNALTKST